MTYFFCKLDLMWIVFKFFLVISGNPAVCRRFIWNSRNWQNLPIYQNCGNFWMNDEAGEEEYLLVNKSCHGLYSSHWLRPGLLKLFTENIFFCSFYFNCSFFLFKKIVFMVFLVFIGFLWGFLGSSLFPLVLIFFSFLLVFVTSIRSLRDVKGFPIFRILCLQVNPVVSTTFAQSQMRE